MSGILRILGKLGRREVSRGSRVRSLVEKGQTFHHSGSLESKDEKSVGTPTVLSTTCGIEYGISSCYISISDWL